MYVSFSLYIYKKLTYVSFTRHLRGSGISPLHSNGRQPPMHVGGRLNQRLAALSCRGDKLLFPMVWRFHCKTSCLCLHWAAHRSPACFDLHTGVLEGCS